MTQVRFGSGAPWGYKAAQWTYNLPERAEKFLSPKVGKGIGGFVKKQLDADFSHFTSMSLGKRFQTLLAEPPRLPLLLLLYPGTVGPRAYRAYQRGKEANDFREVGDVLRRDMTAITLFVFALSPLVNFTSRLMEGLSGVNLVKKKEGGVLSYSDFRNYEITNPKALWQVVKEGNDRGLKNAINGLKDGGLNNKHQDNSVSKALDALKESVENFLKNHKPDSNEKEALEAAGKTYQHFDIVEDKIKDVLDKGYKTGSKDMMDIAKNLQGQAKGALKNYAKVRRLPSDMLSFAVMIGLIGWAPMAFNGWWNKKQFQKQQQAGTANPPAQPALPTQPVQRAFPQPAIGFQPFAGFPNQRPANPFNRQV